MNEKLARLNESCISLERDINRYSIEEISQFSQQAYTEFYGNWSKAQRSIETLILDFWKFVSELSPEEIIEGYQRCCSTLKRALGGYMVSEYVPLYKDLMIRAVNNGDDTGYLFLGKLNHEMGDAVKPIIVDALTSSSKRLRETALGIVRERNILDAIPTLQKLVRDDNPILANEATELINQLLHG